MTAVWLAICLFDSRITDSSNLNVSLLACARSDVSIEKECVFFPSRYSYTLTMSVSVSFSLALHGQRAIAC